MKRSVFCERIVLATIVWIAMSQNAFAYIDPGTGSVVTTAILGFLAAIVYTFRKYLYRLKDLFSGGKKDQVAEGEGSDVDK